MALQRLLARLAAGPASLIAGALRRGGRATTVAEAWVDTPGGRVYCHLHRPAGAGPHPGLVFVPGGVSPGTDYDRARELTADDAAAAGFAVLHYDPSGRGRTGGVEDRWGSAHQDELANVVRWFSRLPVLDGREVGLLSFSIGVTIATGALARHALPVSFLFDWEGPSNRRSITLDDTFEPLRGYPTTDEAFWAEREAARFIGDIACGYFRYQAAQDHVQGTRKSHAIELVNLATRGRARWTQCNDNPADTLFDERRADSYRWVPAHRNTRAQLLRFLAVAHAHVQDRQ
jgi:hypothetical protein